MKATEVKRRVLRFEGKTSKWIEDDIVTEYAVTVKINGEEFVTMVCSPEYIEDMVIGYLASEGVIKNFGDIEEIWVQENEGFVHVKLNKMNPFYQNFSNKRYITSCCGMSRQGFVFVNDALTAKKMNDIHVRVTPEDCYRLMKELQESAFMFKKTGGVHNAALCSLDGGMISRMDIGRHNALDKIYGHCLKNDIEIRGKILVFSGRISSEILLKVAKIGCEIVVSKSAPTELALQAAEELGITAIGFTRNQAMNVYTCPDRVIGQ